MVSLRKALTTVLILMLCGCGPSNEWVAETARQSIEQTLTTDPRYSEYKLTVQSVTVVHEAEGRYQGLVTVSLEGEEYRFPVSITADSDNVIWRSEPGAFTFLFQHHMKKLESMLDGSQAAKNDAPPPPAQASSEVQWVLQVASLSNKEKADKLVNDLKKAGYIAYIRSDAKMNRIYAGPYKERKMADWVKGQLMARHKIMAFVVRYEPEKTGANLLVVP